MNKKITAIFLTLIICVMSACSLVDTPPVSDEQSTGFTDDYLVGIIAYMNVYKPDGVESLTSGDIFDEGSLRMFHRTMFENGFPYSTFECSRYFSDVSCGMTNAGAAPDGKLKASASLYFTYELINAILSIEGVYKESDDTYYTNQVQGYGYSLNDIGSISTTVSQNMSVSYKASDGSESKITYDGEFILKIEFINFLTAAKIIEFNSLNAVIKESPIDLSNGDAPAYIPSDGCEYIIVQEEYEVKHDPASSSRKKGDKYAERTIYSKSPFPQYIYLKAPAQNGFVKTVSLALNFS